MGFLTARCQAAGVERPGAFYSGVTLIKSDMHPELEDK
jgi:hypothetical protein